MKFSDHWVSGRIVDSVAEFLQKDGTFSSSRFEAEGFKTRNQAAARIAKAKVETPFIIQRGECEPTGLALAVQHVVRSLADNGHEELASTVLEFMEGPLSEEVVDIIRDNTDIQVH